MSSGILSHLSQFLGLSPFNSKGKFDAGLMVWSLAVHLGWLCLTLWAKVIGYGIKSQVSKTNGLSDSIWNFQLLAHTGCISYQMYMAFSERRKIEEILSVANSVDLNKFDQIHPIVTTISMFLCWYSGYMAGGGLEFEFALVFGCEIYSIFTDSLIILQFCSLVTHISAKFREMRVSIRRYRRIDYLAHSRLVELAEDANRIYDVQLLIICTEIFATLVSASYSFYIRFNDGGDMSGVIPEFISIIIMVAYEVRLVYMLSESCEGINEDADSFNMELFGVMRAEKALCNNDGYYLYVVVRQSVEMTACGFFYIGYPLVTSIIGAACTYLVILIQFS